MFLRLPLLSSLLLLAACASQPPADSAADSIPDSASGACQADAAQGHVGQPATDASIEAARIAVGAKSVRVLKPGQPATMDYRHDRVNVLLDDAGNIARITCG